MQITICMNASRFLSLAAIFSPDLESQCMYSAGPPLYLHHWWYSVGTVIVQSWLTVDVSDSILSSMVRRRQEMNVTIRDRWCHISTTGILAQYYWDNSNYSLYIFVKFIRLFFQKCHFNCTLKP